MRKYLIIFAILLAFIGTNSVDAATLTDVVTGLEGSEYYQTMNSEGVSANITSTDDSITISYIDEENNAWQTKFTYSNDIISYSFTGDKNGDTTFGQTFVDAIWINELTEVVGTLNGYSNTEVSEWMQTMTEESLYAMETIGVEYTSFYHNYEGIENDASVSLSGTSFDTFKIKLNGFDIDENQDNKEEFGTVTNPQTGIKENLIAFASVTFLSLIALYKLNKRKIFIRI